MKTFANRLADILTVIALCGGLAVGGLTLAAELAHATPQTGGYGTEGGK